MTTAKQAKIKSVIIPLAESVLDFNMLSLDEEESLTKFEKQWYFFLERALELEYTDESIDLKLRQQMVPVLAYLNTKQKNVTV